MRRVAGLSSSLALILALLMPGATAAFSTHGRCLGLLVQTATLEVPPGFWSEGTHTFSTRFVDPMFDYDEATPPIEFVVDGSERMYAGQVRVDWEGLFLGYGQPDQQVINPAQDTVMWAAWAWDMTGEVFGGPPSKMADVKADAAQAWIAFSWDGGDWVRARMSPYHSTCANGALSGTNDLPLFHRTWGPNH